jgi:hypothetical protein
MSETVPGEAFWIELEYKALRDEQMSLVRGREVAGRFFLTAASSVYIVPYALKRTDDMFLWTVSVSVSGLLLLAMVRSLYSCTAGIRRIGVYIKERLEKESGGGLMWHHVISRFDQSRAHAGQFFTVAGIAILANVIAAVSAERIFLRPNVVGWPGIAAAIVALLSAPTLWKMATPGYLRRLYSAGLSAAIEAETKDRKRSEVAEIPQQTISAIEAPP